MLFQPRTDLEAGMDAAGIGEYKDVAHAVVGFEVSGRRKLAFRIARDRTAGQHFAIAYPQSSVHRLGIVDHLSLNILGAEEDNSS